MFAVVAIIFEIRSQAVASAVLTLYVDQAALIFIEIHLTLLPKS